MLKQKTLDPGPRHFRGRLRRGDVYRVFRPAVEILILFHHPAKAGDSVQQFEYKGVRLDCGYRLDLV